MSHFYWFFILVLFSLPAYAQGFTQRTHTLSQQAQISLLTSSPNNDAVFTLYGHTALRVHDPATKADWVFNYGTFDSSKPNFIYRFAKGETDYKLGVSPFSFYLLEYTSRGSEICEQVLNLLQEEKEALWQALIWNMQEENRVYRYNFFFDNCATRPSIMIENNIRNFISYVPATELPTFRDVINNCTRDYPWVTFGCDLVLGLPTDRTMTLQETFFIPEYLKNALDKAEIIREDQSVPLVKQTIILAEEDQPTITQLLITSPLGCFSLLFIFLQALTYFEYRRKSHYRLVDIMLFFSASIAGSIIFFLSFLSVHPGIFPNINLLWLHPLHLVGIIFFSIKKFKLLAYWYHFTNFAVILLMCAGWFFIPQHFNMAFIPLIASLLLRSGSVLFREKTLNR